MSGGAPSLSVAPLPGGLFVADVFSGAHELTISTLARLDEDGAPLWASGFGGDAGEPGRLGLAADGAGSVVLTGVIHGLSDLGGDQLVDAQDQDLVFLAKHDAAVRTCGTAPSA